MSDLRFKLAPEHKSRVSSRLPGPNGVPTIAGMLRWLIVALGALLVVPAAASAESESVTSGDDDRDADVERRRLTTSRARS